ncbi:hypothetical protein Daus18300_009399 [Diaporthe australafricana]|uniref:BTB domain-containing protein n=1 Tax=Diaporthe australafricana TaxID=127596 RepID=A0ABR3WEJ4_9PEZI
MDQIQDPPLGQNPQESPFLAIAPGQGNAPAADCIIIFFTHESGVVLHALARRDALIQGSGFFRKLLSKITAGRPIRQACDIEPLAAILSNDPSGQAPDGFSLFRGVLRYLQSRYDRPGDSSVLHALGYRVPDDDRRIPALINLCTIAYFFEIQHLQDRIPVSMSKVMREELRTSLLVFNESSAGPARFKQYDKASLLQQTALALEKAANIVPATSVLCHCSATFLRAISGMLDDTDQGNEAKQHIWALNRFPAFVHAWISTDTNPQLEGIFPAATVDSDGGKECACAGCSKRVRREDVVRLTDAEVALGEAQEYALVNPFDGYRTLFCDFCRRGCGVPWARTNVPRAPHE